MSLYIIIISRVIKEALFKISLQVCDPPSCLFSLVCCSAASCLVRHNGSNGGRNAFA